MKSISMRTDRKTTMGKVMVKKVATVIAVAAMIIVGMPVSASAAKKVTLTPKTVSVKVGKSKKLTLKNNTKKVTWTIASGKKYVTLKNKKKKSVTVVGKKEGRAKVQAKVGKKKYTCIVTVMAEEATTNPADTPSEEPSASPTPKPAETLYVNPNASPITLEYNGSNADEIRKEMEGSWEIDSNDKIIVNQPYHIKILGNVTSIEKEAFSGCTSLTDIEFELPSKVTDIGERAFESCEGLTNLVIPNGVTSIGREAFQCCRGLKNLTISDSVMSIGNWAFHSCTKLASLTIPDDENFG